jgi:hypothetical protein
MARIASRLALAACATFVVAGCQVKVHRVAADSTRLVQAGVEQVPLACPHRLGNVVDARDSAADRAGGLSAHMFVFEDVPGVVRQQFARAGLVGDGEGPAVDVRILQFYLSQNTITKVPVAVYEVRVGGGEPMLLRSQKASMNWNGTENEAYAAYARALGDATAQTIARLNAGCPKAG